MYISLNIHLISHVFKGLLPSGPSFSTTKGFLAVLPCFPSSMKRICYPGKNSCSSLCCVQYRNFQSSSPLHQNIAQKHNSCTSHVPAEWNISPSFWHTHILNPLSCWGDSCYVATANTTAGSGGHPSGATCGVTVGFPSLAWSAWTHTRTKSAFNVQRPPAGVTHFWHPAQHFPLCRTGPVPKPESVLSCEGRGHWVFFPMYN